MNADPGGTIGGHEAERGGDRDAPARGLRAWTVSCIRWMLARRRRLATGALAAGLVLLVTIWLLVHRVPAWYRPCTLDDSLMPAVRAQATRWVDTVSDQMVLGQPFTVELDEAEINRFIAARADLWPEGRTDFPDGIAGPAVAFEEGRVRVGCVVRVAGDDRAGGFVVSVAAVIEFARDTGELRLRLESTRVGALPLPLALVRRAIQRYAGPQAADAMAKLGEASAIRVQDPRGAAEQWFDHGVAMVNRFRWPNGERRFRIEQVEVSPGRCRVTIDPL